MSIDIEVLDQIIEEMKLEEDKKGNDDIIAPILPSVTPTTIPFPVDALPTELKELALAGNHAFKLPYEFFAVPSLVASATAIGGKYEIASNKSMTTKPILYACIIASAGSGKSPAQDIAFKPIYSIQKNMNEDYKKRYSDYQFEKDEHDLKKKKAKKDNEVLDEPCPEPPTLRELFTTDATTEALAIMLQNNSNGIVLIQDEFLRLYNSLDSYRGGKGGDLQFFLSLWSNRNIKVNRVSKPPLFVEMPVGHIIGAMTPSGINEIARDNNTENGFLDRFLFSFPTDVGMMRTVNAGIDQEVERKYHNLLIGLYEQQVLGSSSKIELDEGAKQVFLEYENFLIEEAGDDEKKRSINSKIKLYALRFALIIHVCESFKDWGFSIDVTNDSMKRGMEIAEYFRLQADRIYHKLELSKDDEQILKIIKMLKEKHVNGTITRRELQRFVQKKSDELERIINDLEKRYIIVELNNEKSGRIVYQIHPHILS